MVFSLVAMEKTQHLRDAVARHARNPYPQERKEEKESQPAQEVPTCAICHEDMVGNTIHTQCIHIFHKPCLAKWYAKIDQPNHTKCPT
jgi:hypothetical protein